MENCAEMLKFLFCTKKNYSVCTIFRLEKRKSLCYDMYNKEEIKQQSKKEKSDNQNQIICDRNEKI